MTNILSKLLLDANGDLFGTTFNGVGVFEIAKTAAGYATTPTTLGSFNGTNGSYPLAGLIADANGNLFGTTMSGGTAGDGTVFEVTNSGYVACYCKGTLIRTVHGDVAVEKLAIGDLLVTASGAHRSLRWIGTRSYVGHFARGNPGILPICIQEGALADGIPARDLMISPKHAMFLDGMLIQAEYLVNGTTIRQIEDIDEVHYYHLELDSHDVIFAEDAPSETYLEDHNRGIFHNAAGFATLYPNARRPREAEYCAPRVEQGFELEVVWQRIATRARAFSKAA